MTSFLSDIRYAVRTLGKSRLTVAATASFAPAFRAARVDPMRTLRSE